MKKNVIVTVLIAIMLFTSSAFAAANIVINNVETKDVKNYIIQRIALSNQNLIQEQSSENNMVFLSTRTQNTGWSGQNTWTYENRLGFLFVQKDKDVILSYSETCTSHAPNGAVYFQAVGSANRDLPFLQKMKGHFNGMYIFGFDFSYDKKDGGYPIKNIIPLCAFDKAGLKDGDVIISVNNVKLKLDKNSGAMDGLVFDTTRETTQTFLVKRKEVQKTFTVKSEYEPPHFIDGILSLLSV